MYRMRILILIMLLLNATNGISFRQIVELPSGGIEKALGFDTDHDGKQNLVDTWDRIYFWEHLGYDRYFLEDTAPHSWIFDIGYLDGDSLVDMVGNLESSYPYPLYVYESPTYNSNPTNIVWQDTGFTYTYGNYITNLDQDDLKEILFGYYNGRPHTCVYENVGDNQYTLVWEDTLHYLGYAVYGDFDLDGKIEFITAGNYVLVWECVGNDNYQLVYHDSLTQCNYIFSGNDMDGNGKPEFLFPCVSYLYRDAWLYLYEMIGDNNYERFLIDSVTNLPFDIVWHESSCGDIDADGREEIVWSTFNQWHIYKATGVHQYQKIYSSTWTTREVTLINIYDLNENGYPEIIESWIEMYNHGTTIWEIEGVRLHKPNGREILHPNQQYPITWQKFDPPGADSFALFFSFNNGNTYDTIITGLGANDTMYLWTVPNVISDSCKIMIWAYGPPRPGEDMPRGTAWDFSDSVFTITDEGIETDTRHQITDYSLKISQNPVSSNNLKIRYLIPRPSKVKLVMYNALGQLEQVLVDKEMASGIYEIGLKNPLTDGVYFIKLIVNKKTVTKKCVILKD